MHTQSVAGAPINERGGQRSYLLLRRGQFGAANLAVTWVDCPAGSQQPLHEHEDREQVYIIVRGRGVMIVGDEERDVTKGTLVFVPPATQHAIRNAGNAPLTFVSATSPPFDDTALSDVFAYHTPQG
jgi:mannose-6-phosphate isomerase-like protein (cupin superfamily)